MKDDNGFGMRFVGVNALLWCLAWAAIGFAGCSVMVLAGVAPPKAGLREVLGLTVRFAFWGALAGLAFGLLLMVARRLRLPPDTGWFRFGAVGAVGAAVFVPVACQALNILSGDGMVPWKLVLDDSVWAAVFGGVAAVATWALSRRLAARRSQA